VTRLSPRGTPGQLAEWFETSLELVDEFESRERIANQVMERFRRKAQHVDLWRNNATVHGIALQLTWLYCGLADGIDDSTVGPRLREAVRFYFAQEFFRATERPADTPGQRAEWFAAAFERGREQALRQQAAKAAA
jgi:hypothetical protein